MVELNCFKIYYLNCLWVDKTDTDTVINNIFFTNKFKYVVLFCKHSFWINIIT